MLLLAGRPVPTPTPTPGPTPTPSPTECVCTVPGPEDPGWANVAVETPYAEVFISKAREVVGDRCGNDPNVTLASMAEAVKAQHLCASGPWADALIVERPDGKFEEWHIVEWTNGCWYPLSKAYKGAWSNALGGCK